MVYSCIHHKWSQKDMQQYEYIIIIDTQHILKGHLAFLLSLSSSLCLARKDLLLSLLQSVQIIIIH